MSITASGLALVSAGGAIGSAARYALATRTTQWAQLILPTTRFPWGTWLVNLLGCCIIGVMAGLALRHAWLSANLRLLLFTGLMGGFTTFSAFGLETVELAMRQHWRVAITYVLSSVLLGLLATAAGFWLGAGAAALGPR